MEINRENVMKVTLKIENSMNECEILQLCSILLLGISHNKERSNNSNITQTSFLLLQHIFIYNIPQIYKKV